MTKPPRDWRTSVVVSFVHTTKISSLVIPNVILLEKHRFTHGNNTAYMHRSTWSAVSLNLHDHSDSTCWFGSRSSVLVSFVKVFCVVPEYYARCKTSQSQYSTQHWLQELLHQSPSSIKRGTSGILVQSISETIPKSHEK